MTRRDVLRIGTRGSQLALWQARTVAALLENAGVRAELVIIRTTGDRLQREALSEAGGKRLFVKEIEDALLGEEVDLAVHSAKDMPAVLPDGLDIAAALPREDPRDALVLPRDAPARTLTGVVAALGDAACVATSSVRRSAQLGALLPGARFMPIRGNVDTRLRKLDEGGCDALVLASAGMRRLGFSDRISAPLPVERCVPAPGQGIVAVEIRSDDNHTRNALSGLDDAAARTALTAERALVAALGGGCQLPLGGVALLQDGHLELHAVVMAPDGGRAIRRTARGAPSDASGLGARVARELAGAGAAEILDAVRAQGR